MSLLRNLEVTRRLFLEAWEACRLVHYGHEVVELTTANSARLPEGKMSMDLIQQPFAHFRDRELDGVGLAHP